MIASLYSSAQVTKKANDYKIWYYSTWSHSGIHVSLWESNVIPNNGGYLGITGPQKSKPCELPTLCSPGMHVQSPKESQTAPVKLGRKHRAPPSGAGWPSMSASHCSLMGPHTARSNLDKAKHHAVTVGAGGGTGPFHGFIVTETRPREGKGLTICHRAA